MSMGKMNRNANFEFRNAEKKARRSEYSEISRGGT
jgi:hypothetical protein